MATEQPTRSAYAHSVSETLAVLDEQLRTHTAAGVRAVPTGFDVLDEVLSGGLRTGELVLLGGPPGVGKTITALQWARNLAIDGHMAVFACYEHEPATLLLRLLALEAGELGGDAQISASLEQALMAGDRAGRSLEEVLATTTHGSAALERLRTYAGNLMLVRASGSRTSLDELADLVRPYLRPETTAALFVDYLQKIPLHPEPDTEAEKVTRTVEGIKDLALDLEVPVVLLSAVDAEGMRAQRLRLYHLRGSSAIAFESDVVIMLNEKTRAVSKVHLSYDANAARGFREWIVLSIEKNRGGPNLIDLEFRKDFGHYRFHPQGGIVKEKLVDERSDESNL